MQFSDLSTGDRFKLFDSETAPVYIKGFQKNPDSGPAKMVSSGKMEHFPITLAGTDLAFKVSL